MSERYVGAVGEVLPPASLGLIGMWRNVTPPVDVIAAANTYRYRHG